MSSSIHSVAIDFGFLIPVTLHDGVTMAIMISVVPSPFVTVSTHHKCDFRNLKSFRDSMSTTVERRSDDDKRDFRSPKSFRLDDN